MHLLNVKVSEFSPFPMLSMFNFIPNSTNVPHLRASIRTCSPINKLRCLTLSTSSAASPVSLSDSPNEQSFVVSYLINSCGLAPEVALSKSRYAKFNTPEKPDTVLAFLKKYGFSETQISNIIGRCPVLLRYNPEKTLLPKLTFLSSLGLSNEEITIIINKAPHILKRSMEKVLIPSFRILRNLLESDGKTVDTIRRYPSVLASAPDKENIEIFREAGVPPVNIVSLWRSENRGCRPTPEDYKKIVEVVKEMGFDPNGKKFISAIKIMLSVRISTWDQKLQVFKKYGWSDRDILLAFVKNPRFIYASVDRIVKVMDFLVTQMGVDAASVADNPLVILLSFEKRIVPRCLIYQALLEKELSRKRRKLKITTLLGISHKQFFVRVIKPYEDEAPELVSLYQKMLDGHHDIYFDSILRQYCYRAAPRSTPE